MGRPSAARLGVLMVGALVAASGCARSPDAPADDASTSSRRPVDVSERAPRAPRGVGRETRDTPPPTQSPAETLDDLVRVDDTFESLRGRLGAQAVVRETLPGAEGEQLDGWVLFPHEPARRVEIVPGPEGRHPALATVGRESRWTRADGVRPGLDLRTLERLNGRPFEFVGFDWDYGGVVTDWKGGALAPGGHMTGPVQLCPPDPRPDDYPVGDGTFESSLPVVQAHPPVVCEVGLALGGPRD